MVNCELQRVPTVLIGCLRVISWVSEKIISIDTETSRRQFLVCVKTVKIQLIVKILFRRLLPILRSGENMKINASLLLLVGLCLTFSAVRSETDDFEVDEGVIVEDDSVSFERSDSVDKSDNTWLFFH